MPRPLRAAAILIACAVLPSSPVLAQDTPSLPGGASSLQETFQDWRVACQIVEAMKRCALSQQQARQDGRRVLAVELQVGPDNAVTGNLVLPFGLLLDAGVALQIDEQPPMEALAFRTCLPQGCIVPITLDQSHIDSLRSGTALKLMAKASGTGEDVAFTIPLNGLSAALDRVRALTEG